MKKIYNKSFWIVFILICIYLFYENTIKKTKFYNSYKYGLRYNEYRLENGIPLLPDNFEKVEDEKFGNLIVWVNKDSSNVSSGFTHLKKILTVRNSEIILEEDLFRLKNNFPSENYEFREIVSKYYYKKRDNRFIYIVKDFSNNILKSVDTIEVSEKFKNLDLSSNGFDL